jgi:hypothetical protein
MFIHIQQKHTKNPSANVRATVATALRFIVIEQPRPVDDYLRQFLDQFLSSIRDPDLNVRRVGIGEKNEKKD